MFTCNIAPKYLRQTKFNVQVIIDIMYVSFHAMSLTHIERLRISLDA